MILGELLPGCLVWLELVLGFYMAHMEFHMIPYGIYTSTWESGFVILKEAGFQEIREAFSVLGYLRTAFFITHRVRETGVSVNADMAYIKSMEAVKQNTGAFPRNPGSTLQYALRRHRFLARDACAITSSECWPCRTSPHSPGPRTPRTVGQLCDRARPAHGGQRTGLAGLLVGKTAAIVWWWRRGVGIKGQLHSSYSFACCVGSLVCYQRISRRISKKVLSRSSIALHALPLNW